MTLKGEGLKAIGVTTISAFVGGIVGCIALLFIAPPLAKIAIRFGPVELFLTIMMGIIIIIGIVKDRALKGLMSACLGFLCSLVGLDGSPVRRASASVSRRFTTNCLCWPSSWACLLFRRCSFSSRKTASPS
jgi:TctA family transporter